MPACAISWPIVVPAGTADALLPVPVLVPVVAEVPEAAGVPEATGVPVAAGVLLEAVGAEGAGEFGIGSGPGETGWPGAVSDEEPAFAAAAAVAWAAGETGAANDAAAATAEATAA